MQLIYVHGLNSDAFSVKGQWLDVWCKLNRPDITVVRPDVNVPPKQVMKILGDLIESVPETMMVGSSLGGFYTTACVAKYGVRAALINPSVRPFETMKKYFPPGVKQIMTETGWMVTPDQFDDLLALFQPIPAYADRMLVLLKEGDEVLDHKVAQEHYGQKGAHSAMVIEPRGDHFMHDLQDKIPMIMNFLTAENKDD